ncbi:hypothetical protein CFP56_005536 [Quercus suber]|uniref:DC1 domain-containing protein n=1 Tax=Quercus suber TaxID=58331 RepID=A0AAW0LBB9_QUESU|nr:uncharacterized protein LOC112012374 [Quercus suber]POF20625.1 hypothetical protein CFP56_77188 [Quercus suber]
MSRIDEIKHSSHRHQLKLMRIETCYQCDGCKEQGLGSFYQCNKRRCGFHLHEECALASGSGSITHPFFKNCHFIFHDEESQSDTILVCVACGKNVQGFMYKSSGNKAHILHPCCLKLPHNRANDQGVNVNLREKLPMMSKCLICQSRKISNEIKGWAYVSSCGKFRYHVACLKDMIFENWNNNVRLLQPTDGRNTSTFSLLLQKSGLTGKNARKYSLEIMKVIVEVIIAALFGDATPIFLTLSESFH